MIATCHDCLLLVVSLLEVGLLNDGSAWSIVVLCVLGGSLGGQCCNTRSKSNLVVVLLVLLVVTETLPIIVVLFESFTCCPYYC